MVNAAAIGIKFARWLHRSGLSIYPFENDDMVPCVDVLAFRKRTTINLTKATPTGALACKVPSWLRMHLDSCSASHSGPWKEVKVVIRVGACFHRWPYPFVVSTIMN